MKKLVFIDSNLNTGGAERILCTLIRNTDLARYKVEVLITGEPGEMCSLLPDGIKVVYLHIKRSRYACFVLAKYFAKNRPDAVFSVSYNSAYLALIARYLAFQNFRITVRHCLMPIQMIREGFLKTNTLQFRLERWLMNRLDCIIAEHKYMMKEIIDVYNIKMEHLTYVLNPLDEPLIKQQIQEEFALPKNQINVVAAGRINREKGFDFLIESFAEVVKADKRFHLYIIGKDINNNQSQLERDALERGCSENIHFEGFQNNPYKYFKASDLYVLSSRWEASPNVVFENLYLGKRIVATDCSPILKDVLSTNGRLVPWGDTQKMSSAILKYEECSELPLKYYSLNDFYKKIIV